MTWPVSASTLAKTTPSGTLKSRTGLSRRAVVMKSTNMGQAVLPPVSPSPSDVMLSYPTQTPHSTSGVYPTNQVSLLSSLVPVFPATGLESALARQPVPAWTTSLSMLVMMKAVCAEMTRVSCRGAWSSEMTGSTMGGGGRKIVPLPL